MTQNYRVCFGCTELPFALVIFCCLFGESASSVCSMYVWEKSQVYLWHHSNSTVKSVIMCYAETNGNATENVWDFE